MCTRRGGRTAIAAALLACIALSAPAALAQDEVGPLRFLKPWLDRQLDAQRPPPTDPAPEPEGGAAAPEPSAKSEAGPDQGESAVAGEPDTLSEDAEQAAPTEAEETPENREPAMAVETRDPTEEPQPAIAEETTPALGTEAAAEAAPSGAGPEQPTEAAASTQEREPQRDPLRFAVLAGRSVPATLQAIRPLADELERLLERPVEFLPTSSYDAMIDAQTQRRVDGGFYSAAAFAEAEARCDCLEPLVAPRAADATLAFHALIVAQNGSGIESLADLRGKTVAVGADDSIGSRRMQLAGLSQENIDPATFFGRVIETDSAEAAVRALASGEADAAFAWSSLSGSLESGYSRGTLTNLVAAGEIGMDEIAILWRSPPITHGPFAVLSTLPEEEKAKIASHLSSLYLRNPAAYDMLSPFYGGGYAEVDRQDYSGVSMLTNLRIEEAVPAAAPTADSGSVQPE